jgi:hypothetical protein
MALVKRKQQYTDRDECVREVEAVAGIDLMVCEGEIFAFCRCVTYLPTLRCESWSTAMLRTTRTRVESLRPSGTSASARSVTPG